MKKTIIILITFLFIFSWHSFLFATLNNTILTTVVDFAAKPNDFFLELNSDIENTGPVPFDNRFQIQTSVIWDLLTVVNAQVKYNVYPESENFPEITPGISYWNLAGAALLPASDVAVSIYGFTPFLTVSKKIETDLKLFAGFKYAVGHVNIQLKNVNNTQGSGAVSLNLNSLSNIDSVYGEPGYYFGMNYLRLSGKSILAMVGYYPDINKMYAKIQFCGTTFDHGLGFYPEGVLAIHYYFNIHFSL